MSTVSSVSCLGGRRGRSSSIRFQSSVLLLSVWWFLHIQSDGRGGLDNPSLSKAKRKSESAASTNHQLYLTSLDCKVSRFDTRFRHYSYSMSEITSPQQSGDVSPSPFALPRVTIRFCTQCKWLLRAAYVCIFSASGLFFFLLFPSPSHVFFFSLDNFMCIEMWGRDGEAYSWLTRELPPSVWVEAERVVTNIPCSAQYTFGQCILDI